MKPNDIFQDIVLQMAERKEREMQQFIKEQGFDSYADLQEKGYEIIHQSKGHRVSETGVTDTLIFKLVKIQNTKTIDLELNFVFVNEKGEEEPEVTEEE